MVNGRPFLNVAGAGFDAAVGADFHARGRAAAAAGSSPTCWLSLARERRATARRTWTLEAGAERFEGRALLVAFVNGRQYGGAAVIAPGARLDDGLLDIVVVEDAPLVELLANAPRLFLGGIETLPALPAHGRPAAVLTGRRAPRCSIATASPSPPPPASRCAVEPRALSVLVPRATAEDPLGPFSNGG